MAENKVQIIIEAVDKAKDILTKFAKDLKDVEGQSKSTGQSMGGLGGVLSSLKENWVALSIGVNQFLEILGKIGSAAGTVYNFVKEGQKVILVETAFKHMADSVGADAEAMISRLKASTKGVMDDTDLMRSATDMMLAGAKPDQIEKLTEAMAKMAPYAGMTLPEGMQRLGTALETGNARAIRAVTGYIDLNYELEVYAQRLGKTADQLSDLARVQATAEILLGRIISKTKEVKDTQELGINTFLRFETAWKNMIEDMQKGVGPFAEIVGWLTKLIGKFNEFNEGQKRSREEFEARKEFAKTPLGESLRGGIGTLWGRGEKEFQEWYAIQKKIKEYQLAQESQDAAKRAAGAAKPGAQPPTWKGATPLEVLQKELTVIQSINDEETKRILALDKQLAIMGMQTKGITSQELAEMRRNALAKITQEFTAPRVQKEMESSLDAIKKRQEIEQKAIEERQAANEQEWQANKKGQQDYLRDKQKLEAEGVALTFKFTEMEVEVARQGYNKLIGLSGDELEKDRLRYDMVKKISDLNQERSLAEQKLAELGIKGGTEELALNKEIIRSIAEGRIQVLQAEIDRQKELNSLRAQAGEISPYEQKKFELDADKAITQGKIEQLATERRIEESAAKRVLIDQQILILQQQLDDVEKRRLSLMEYQGDMNEGFLAGLKQYVYGLKTYFQEGRDLAKGSAQAMQDSFGTLFFDAMQGKIKRGIDYWRQFVGSIEKMLSDLLAKRLMEQIIGAQSGSAGGGGGYGGILGMLLAYFGTSPSAGATGTAGGTESGIFVPVEHGGKGPGETPVRYRLVPSETFISAPRFHIGKGEMPAIIKDDESIFTPGQLRALGRGQRGGSAPVYNFHMQVNTIDSLSFQRYALQHKAVFADAIRAAQKENHPARRGG
jgi:hypothetical protein